MGARVAHVALELGGEYEVVAAPLEGLAHDLLGLAGRVDIGGVDEVDAGIERGVDDGGAVVVVGIVHAPEHHRPQAEVADLDPGVSQTAVLHVCSLAYGVGARPTTYIPVLRRCERKTLDRYGLVLLST